VERRLLMTGTPLANGLADWYVLADLARPGRLGTRQQYELDFVQPVAAGEPPSGRTRPAGSRAHARPPWARPPPIAGEAAGASAADKALGALQARLLRAIVAEIMLRRTNAELSRGLLEKHAYAIAVAPTAVQRAVHETITSDKEGVAFSRLQLVRSNLVHPPLLVSTEGGGSREGAQALRRTVAELHEAPATRVLYSAKLQACTAIIDRALPAGDKVVVVSGMLNALSEIGEYVRTCHDERAVVSLLGSMSGRARRKVVATFNTRDSGVKVCLLSAKLAEGINLVGGNHLVIIEPWWNPAQDRCPPRLASQIWQVTSLLWHVARAYCPRPHPLLCAPRHHTVPPRPNARLLGRRAARAGRPWSGSIGPGSKRCATSTAWWSRAH
jgi:DNA repair and recombination RAD54-like protein